MPHLSLYALEQDIAGREDDLVRLLTDAVADVYGDWARDMVQVIIIGIPRGRWAVAGAAVHAAAPILVMGVRESAFRRDDADELVARLADTLTDAIAEALGDDVRSATQIEFVAVPSGRSALGGAVVTF